MSSAKTVAQKPAGNVNPLSSWGHAWRFASAAGLDWFRAGANELPMDTAASATTAEDKVLNGLDNCTEHSRRSAKRNNGLTRENTTKIYSRYCSVPAVCPRTKYFSTAIRL